MNRVTREYKEYRDRFIRVNFNDEDYSRLNVGQYSNKGVLQYFRKVMKIGFTVAGRKYEFLGFSSSQLREHSCWFFSSPGTHLTCDDIRQWMGDFSGITNAAKYAARMGQCFSSTVETCAIQQDEWEVIPDIETKTTILDYMSITSNKKYIFSDGIGKISTELSDEIARILGLGPNDVSAFQIRFGGAKGVVAKDPNLTSHKLQIRPSMMKFQSDHPMLEVNGPAKEHPYHLNRQIIILMSALGIPDSVFEKLQETMLKEIDCMLTDPSRTALILRKYHYVSSTISKIGSLLKYGFTLDDPYIYRLLIVIRVKVLIELKARSRIFVPKGSLLMGVLDEYQLLKPRQVYIRTTTHGIITGKVVVAKNPCFHPGDIRVFEAVDIPELNHMINTIVFPSVGDRPHPNELSGSDLDGDLYHVTWEDEIINNVKGQYKPMNYDAPAPNDVGSVTMDHLFTFFTDYIENDNLGVIANNHLAIADESDKGVLDERCIRLAELHSIAVDYPKTGIKAILSPDLKTKIKPDFMEKNDKKSRKSTKVIGRMYREIKVPIYSQVKLNEEPIVIDPDITIDGYEEYMEEARKIGSIYNNALRDIINDYRGVSEAELMTLSIVSLSSNLSRQQRFQQLEKIKNRMDKFLKRFQKMFKKGVKSSKQERLKKACAWYKAGYEFAIREQQNSNHKKKKILLSFAYIAAEEIAIVKQHSRGNTTSV
jgi:RNA-dependent RNA polymerase